MGINIVIGGGQLKIFNMITILMQVLAISLMGFLATFFLRTHLFKERGKNE